MTMPGNATVTPFTVRYSGTIRDFYRAQFPGDLDVITPGIGPSAEMAVTDLFRNYIAETR